VVVRTPALLTPMTAEHVLLPSGRKEALPKTTPQFRECTGEFLPRALRASTSEVPRPPTPSSRMSAAGGKIN
jgi:hypothetical protein